MRKMAAFCGTLPYLVNCDGDGNLICQHSGQSQALSCMACTCTCKCNHYICDCSCCCNSNLSMCITSQLIRDLSSCSLDCVQGAGEISINCGLAMSGMSTAPHSSESNSDGNNFPLQFVPSQDLVSDLNTYFSGKQTKLYNTSTSC